MPATPRATPSPVSEKTGFVYTLPGVLLVVLAYALLHTTLRLGSSGNLGDEDPIDNLLAQTLSAGYRLEKGPLYDWMLWAAQHVAGTGLPSFLLLKYTMLLGIAAGIYRITHRLTRSAMWSFIAVESMVMVYQIFWRFHEGFTHTAAALLLTVGAVWTTLRLIDEGRWRHRWGLAVCIGGGLLTEHSFVTFLVAWVLACAAQAPVRRAVFNLKTLAVLPVVVLMVSPYALWGLAQLQTGGWTPDESTSTAGQRWLHSLFGLRDALTYPVLVLAPYILLPPLLFPRILQGIRGAWGRPDPHKGPDIQAFIVHLLLAEVVVMVVKDGLLFPRWNYAVQSAIPLFIFGIPWITALIQQSQPDARRVQTFILVMAGFSVFAFAMRSGNLYVNEPFCSRCRWGVPYPALAQELKQRGFQGGTIVTDDVFIAGNMRRFFPHSRIEWVNKTYPLRAAPSQQVAVIWASDGSALAPHPAITQRVAGLETQAEAVTLPWHHLWRPSGYRESTWRIVVTDSKALR